MTVEWTVLCWHCVKISQKIKVRKEKSREARKYEATGWKKQLLSLEGFFFIFRWLTLRSRWTTPIWWQWSTASRICWMQWLHANTRGLWVSHKLPLIVCSCELALILGEVLLTMLAEWRDRNVATNPLFLSSSHNYGHCGDTAHLVKGHR